MPSNKPWLLFAAFVVALTSGCMTVQPAAFPIGRQRPARPEQSPVQLFKDAPPSRPYEEVARLNVHIEKTFFIPSAFAEALPQLEKLARQNGADAIISVQEKKSRLNETFIYNVSAIAVVFVEDSTLRR
jgi:hypothetical protein